MPISQHIRRFLLALAGLVVALAAGASTAQAEYGELGSPIDLTGIINAASPSPRVFGRDPTDGSFYIGDEVVEGSKEFYRIQKFSAAGAVLAEAHLLDGSKGTANANTAATKDLESRALKGIAVDPVAKRVYLLLDSQREREEHEFDPEAPAAKLLYAFSTEVNNSEHKLEPAAGTHPGGVLTEFDSESEEEKIPLLEPHGIALDPATGDVVIVGQQDELTVKELGEEKEPKFRAALQFVGTSGFVGPKEVAGSRYVDRTNCLGEGNASGGEPACEETLTPEVQPFSPVVSATGKVYVERDGEIWEIPASGAEFGAPASQQFETLPKRIFTLTPELVSEQTILQFPNATENPNAEEAGGIMSLVSTGSDTGRIYAGTGVSGAPGILVLGYEEKGAVTEVKELGWTGGGEEGNSAKCVFPERENDGRLLATDGEDVFVLAAHNTALQHPRGAELLEFGPGGAGCPHAEATVPSVKVKNTEGKEVEVSPVPLGDKAILASSVSKANAIGTEWKFKNLSTGHEDAPAKAGYQFQATAVEHEFAEAGNYEITEIVETDDFASPKIEVTKQVTVAAQPVAVQFSFPGTVAVGAAAKFEASVSDSQEPATTHLKYVWKFGDGAEKSGETTSKQFSEQHTYSGEGAKSVTLTVTDSHGASGEVTHTVVVKTEEPSQEGSKVIQEQPKMEAKSEPPGKTSGPAGDPEATLAGNSLSVSAAGAMTLKVSCPAGETSCAGTVTLRTLGAVAAAAHGKKGRRKAILTLASGSFAVAGGHAQSVTLHLSAAARALLARSHVLRVRATLVAHDPTGATRTTQAIVTLRAGRSKSHHKH